MIYPFLQPYIPFDPLARERGMPPPWFNGSWREREGQRAALPPEPSRAMPLRHFNPACAHDRTSYSINTCDQCRAFSAPLNPPSVPHYPV